jgi:hypothetical protein
MRKEIIEIILKNLDHKSLKEKLISLKNKFMRKLFYSILYRYLGSWERLDPYTGNGLFYNDESLYTGDWKEGKGTGTVSTNVFNYYFIGDWVNNSPIKGEGTFKIGENFYQGVWKNYQFEGKILNHKFKTVFIGKESSNISGMGDIVHSDRIYSGVWNKSKGSGKIISHLSNKRKYVYTGEWEDFCIIKGHGSIVEDESLYNEKYNSNTNNLYSTGEIISIYNDKYIGQWDEYFWPIKGEGLYVSNRTVKYIGKWDGKIGRGEIHSSSCSGKNKKNSNLNDLEEEPFFDCIYRGTWDKNGLLLEGEGVFFNYDGNKFEGSWDPISKEGQGTITFPNGEMIIAKWDSFRRITQGEGVYYDKDHRKYIGKIDNGLGTGKIISLDGLLYEGTWDVDGLPIDGEGIFVHSGVIFKGIWKNSMGEGFLFS